MTPPLKEKIKNENKKFQQNFSRHFQLCSNAFVQYIRDELKLKDQYVDRCVFLIKYTCEGGKNIRGHILVNMVQKLCKIKGINFDDKIERKAFILACCIEILQSSFLTADDLMDKSEMRRGKPCWYRLPEIKSSAINDAIILEHFVYFILRKFLKGDSDYVNYVDLYHDITLKTLLGQMIDLLSQKRYNSIEEFSKRFSKENYEAIIVHKTAYYTYYIPIASAMILCGLNSDSQRRLALKISLELGKKFQIQDDFLDCFSDSLRLGKVGKDIEENKCSWLVVNALVHCNDRQKMVLMEHYGRENPADKDIIKALYRELGMAERYAEQEKQSYDEIFAIIEAGDSIIPKEIFMPLLQAIQCRTY